MSAAGRDPVAGAALGQRCWDPPASQLQWVQVEVEVEVHPLDGSSQAAGAQEEASPMGEEGGRPPGRGAQGSDTLLTPVLGEANARAGNHHPAWRLAPLQGLSCTPSLLSPCSLQHNTIKEDGATFLAEALLTNHRLTTLQ